eukprot:TRINITY_DN4478_c0_g3_i1.p1 TRINITY_DN4478_c0_g3~~TRINITY_DN4478_c0_g3_i1.p1  ORF type:complete len:341 (-),score=80.42 TRINITY_DN4478_c0_g3_i1:104-1078(-)
MEALQADCIDKFSVEGSNEAKSRELGVIGASSLTAFQAQSPTLAESASIDLSAAGLTVNGSLPRVAMPQQHQQQQQQWQQQQQQQQLHEEQWRQHQQWQLQQQQQLQYQQQQQQWHQLQQQQQEQQHHHDQSHEYSQHQLQLRGATNSTKQSWPSPVEQDDVKEVSVSQLARAQTECCMRFFTVLIEGVLAAARSAGGMSLRLGVGADCILVGTATWGIFHQGDVATAHVVNLLVLMVAVLGFVTQTRIPQIAVAREFILSNIDALEQLEGVAAMRTVESILALALAHDHKSYAYASGGFVAFLSIVLIGIDMWRGIKEPHLNL